MRPAYKSNAVDRLTEDWPWIKGFIEHLFYGGFLLASVLGLVGCLSRPALQHQSFGLQPATLLSNTNSHPLGVLAIRTVQVNPLFERRSFVYRLGPELYESDPYAEFMVIPSRALATAIRACLRSSGCFENVVEPGSQLEPNAFLEVHARELYGDFQKSGAPEAVLSLSLLLFESGTGQEQKLVSQKDYARRVRLKEATAVALAAGWNQALAELMTEACSDFANARAKTTTRN